MHLDMVSGIILWHFNPYPACEGAGGLRSGFCGSSLCFSQQSQVDDCWVSLRLSDTRTRTTVIAVWRVWLICALLWRWKVSTPSGPAEQGQDAQLELTRIQWSFNWNVLTDLLMSQKWQNSEYTSVFSVTLRVTVDFHVHVIHNKFRLSPKLRSAFSLLSWTT